MSAGPHRVRAEAPGYVTAEREITLERDLVLELVLLPASAPASPSSPRMEPPPARRVKSGHTKAAQRASAAPGPSPPATKPPATKKGSLSLDRANPWQPQ
jgi:hypothetical protein